MSRRRASAQSGNDGVEEAARERTGAALDSSRVYHGSHQIMPALGERRINMRGRFGAQQRKRRPGKSSSLAGLGDTRRGETQRDWHTTSQRSTRVVTKFRRPCENDVRQRYRRTKGTQLCERRPRTSSSSADHGASSKKESKDDELKARH